MTMVDEIVLRCIECKQLCPKTFKSTYRGVFQLVHKDGDSTGNITIDLDCAMVPGTDYHLLLKGVFPGSCEGRTCLSSMLRLQTAVDDAALTSVNTVDLERIRHAQSK